MALCLIVAIAMTLGVVEVHSLIAGLPRVAMLARCMLSPCVYLSVCLCIRLCLPHAAIVYKRLNVQLRKQRHTIAQGL